MAMGCEPHGHINCTACADAAVLNSLWRENAALREALEKVWDLAQRGEPYTLINMACRATLHGQAAREGDDPAACPHPRVTCADCGTTWTPGGAR